MTTKIKIIEQMLIRASILTAEQINKPIIKQIINDSKDMISFDTKDEDDWQVGMHPTKDNPNGFIYFSWNNAQLNDLIHAISVWKMLNANGAEPAP